MLTENIEIIKTKDGSIGLYDKSLDEIFHSIYGAKTEAFEKFIQPAKIIDNKPLKILDICYGIGYNTKCALENFKNISFIDCDFACTRCKVNSCDRFFSSSCSVVFCASQCLLPPH